MRLNIKGLPHCSLAFALLLAVMPACAQSQPVQTTSETDLIEDTGQGQVDFSSDEISELSGITYLGSNRFAVVSDKGGKLGIATININLETGGITRASLDDAFVLDKGHDFEGIAIDRTGSVLLVADELGQSLKRYRSANYEWIGDVSTPEYFKKARPNLGFEAVSDSRGQGRMWAANEEPLTADGPRSTKEAGGLIRLQRFGLDLKPDEQFAYRIDPHRGNDNIIKRAQSGVSGLVALPNGGLIVMERELGGDVVPTFRIRLYLIDTSDATDTSEVDSLTEEDVTPVRKQLLFESNTGPANFEGVTLGPRLNDGDYTLILVSDDGGKYNPQRLLSLRIPASYVEPAPQSPDAPGAE